jgi:hypothetical protein
MAGVLSFALGLESSAFSAGLDRAGGRLLAFMSVGKLVQEAIEGITKAMERGGAFNDLSNRTGESISTLYRLDSAFKQVGISSDALPGMINRFNKSLSGVGEMGERTSDAFAALGLDMASLKGMDATEQIAAVAEKLALLGKGDREDVAARLFGREGAANVLQISRDLSSFKETLTATRGEAELMARTAPKFDAVGDAVQAIRRKANITWTGIAEGLIPLEQRLLRFADGIDFQGTGERIGAQLEQASEIFMSALDAGKMQELLSGGFEAAVEYFGNAIFNTIGSPGFWDGCWDVMKGEFLTKWGVITKTVLGLGSFLAAALDTAIQMAIESLSSLPGVGKLLGTENFHALSFSQNWENRKTDLAGAQDVTSGWIADGVASAKAGAGKIGTAISEGMDAASNGPAQERFRGTLASLTGGIESRKLDDSINALMADYLDPASWNFDAAKKKSAPDDLIKPNSTALEKMGFVFGGGSAFDPSKQTAANTKQTVQLLDQVIKVLGKSSPQSLVNQ